MRLFDVLSVDSCHPISIDVKVEVRRAQSEKCEHIAFDALYAIAVHLSIAQLLEG